MTKKEMEKKIETLEEAGRLVENLLKIERTRSAHWKEKYTEAEERYIKVEEENVVLRVELQPIKMRLKVEE